MTVILDHCIERVFFDLFSLSVLFVWSGDKCKLGACFSSPMRYFWNIILTYRKARVACRVDV